MENAEQGVYEISAVARLTGISSHVLRVWERRYGVVTPRRSETKRRQYSQSDIHRLSLLKTLVDNGHSIGTIAKLSTSQLEERVASTLDTQVDGDAPAESGPAGICRICLAGTVIRDAVRDAVEGTPALRIVGDFQEMSQITASLRPGAVDLLILEQDTLFPEDIEAVQDLVAEMRVRRAILIYRFAREDVIQPLDIKKITALRAPVDAAEIQLACIADIQLALRSGEAHARRSEEARENGEFDRPTGPIPERAFSDEQLVEIGRISSVVKCECPQHLANLLSSLSAFEKYSEQCEDRNQDDANLHAFLHKTTADCRSRMEIALSEVLTQEGISIEG